MPRVIAKPRMANYESLSLSIRNRRIIYSLSSVMTRL